MTAAIAGPAALASILEAMPDFLEPLETHRATWDEPPGLCNELGQLVTFVVRKAQRGEHDQLAALFAAVERLLADGTEDVKDAVATCFLESLVNVIASRPEPEKVIARLGPLAKAHCRAWDAHTDTRTPGL